MQPYFQDDSVTLYQGAAVKVLAELPPASVACIVTSPPYFGLRSYGDSPDEQGGEPTLPDFIAGLRDVFREARRVLEPGGTMWVNIGDTYSSKANARIAYTGNRAKGHGNIAGVTPPQRNTTKEAPYKSLLMVPERLAMSLVDDGWLLRNRITWHKTNGTPESVVDRFTAKSEALFLFSKSTRYWFDLDSLREAHTMRPQRRLAKKVDAIPRGDGQPAQTWASYSKRRDPKVDGHPLGRNPGDCWTIDDPAGAVPEVWSVPTQPFKGAHFAVMAPEIARRAIIGGCRPGGTVLDPYSGSGTTGMVAAQLGHPYIGVDLYKEYLDLSLSTRLANAALLDA